MLQLNKARRPLCRDCGHELVTPDDLPRDENPYASVNHPAWAELEDWPKSDYALCTDCADVLDPDAGLSSNRHWYLALPYSVWRSRREALEEKRLQRWNESVRSVSARAAT